MKKWLVVILVLSCAVFGTSSMLLAWEGPGGGPGWRHGAGGGYGWQRSSFPPEIQSKMEDLWKTNRELHDALSVEKPNQVQARLLFEKSWSLRHDIARWRFDQQCAGNDSFMRPEWRDRRDTRGGHWDRRHRDPRFRQGPRDFRRDLNSLPAEIRVKIEELREINRELGDVMAAERPDETKARALYEKSEKLRQEIGRWEFERRFENKAKVPAKPAVQ